MFNLQKFILIEESTQHSCYDIQIVYFVVHGINKSVIIILSLYKQYYENDGTGGHTKYNIIILQVSIITECPIVIHL